MERFLKRNFREVFVGQWIEFRDSQGRGFAQPDFYIHRRDFILCIEAKYTQCEDGETQIDLLYRPLLKSIYGLPVVGVQVCRNLVREPEHLLFSPVEAFVTSDPLTWHFLG